MKGFLGRTGQASESVQIVSIVGGQSSGKSTLCNKLFGTDFALMNSQDVPHMTTTGVWAARSPANEDLLVIDTQGTDSVEAGES